MMKKLLTHKSDMDDTAAYYISVETEHVKRLAGSLIKTIEANGLKRLTCNIDAITAINEQTGERHSYIEPQMTIEKHHFDEGSVFSLKIEDFSSPFYSVDIVEEDGTLKY